MPTLIDAIYENGVLKPLVDAAFRENHQYKVILDEPVMQGESQRNGATGEQQAGERPKRDFTLEVQWLSQHRHEYAGQYVALDGDRLVGHGTNGREVYRQAQAAGVQHPYMAHIEAVDAPPFGGW